MKEVLGSSNQNPKDISLFELLKEDYLTHDKHLAEAGLWAVWLHRLGNARMDLIKPFRAPATLAYKTCRVFMMWGPGVKLDYTVKLGRRPRIWHNGAMIFGARSIGDDVNLRQSTTIGVAGLGGTEKPIIGDRVDIGAGAVIIGGVTIGNDCVIGANAVVNKDVPANHIAVGVPAKLRLRKTLKVA